MNKRSLKDLDPSSLAGRRVLVRADLNVPLEDGDVGDETRLRATLPTLRRLMDARARVVVISHLGRPRGVHDATVSLRPVARRLSELMGAPVGFAADLVGAEACETVEGLSDGGVAVLENTRFHPGETKNDPELAHQLAGFAEVYVNDAFGAAHRAHASTEGVARAVREKGRPAVAGLLMERELDFLGRALTEPERPFVAVLGGAKISGKIDVVQALLPRVDRLLVGGAMANTFFLALGLEVGESLVEADRVAVARQTLEEAGDRFVLPVDCLVSERLEAGVKPRAVARSAVGAPDRIGDNGPASRALFTRELSGARTVVWNGPMGVFELEPFREGTVAVARAVADATDRGALSVVGGGDSAAAAEVAGVTDRLSHVSTGGGASLEFLAGADLPGVAALDDA
ncbi:MAG: phosphoglycerate kinase [Gemmatimonadetes bacterium]|nr:phosphoglycerate kinase [Gemmatimonadota bacterium]